MPKLTTILLGCLVVAVAPIGINAHTQHQRYEYCVSHYMSLYPTHTEELLIRVQASCANGLVH